MLQRLTLLVLLLWCNALEAQNRELLGEYKIGIVGRDQENAIYQATREGAQAAALKLNEKYSIDIELVIFTPDKNKGGSQMTSLAELFIENADGLIISPENTEAVRASIDFALQQGQEGVFFESQLSDRESLTSVLADEVEAGRLAGRAILAKLPTKARVAILTSATPSAELEQRMTGLREVLSYRRIETTITCAPDYLSAIEAIRAAEEADRNDLIKGWVFLEDWPLLGLPAGVLRGPSAVGRADHGREPALPRAQGGRGVVQRPAEELRGEALHGEPQARQRPAGHEAQGLPARALQGEEDCHRLRRGPRASGRGQPRPGHG